MKNFKISLFILAIILFVSNYQICEYFYSNNVNSWWKLKLNIYDLIFAIILFSASINKNGILRFVLDIGTGFAISSAIDKVLLNVSDFKNMDIIMISLTILLATFNYLKNYNDGRTDN